MGLVTRITEKDQEILGLYVEEMGEACQVLGKILRHGLDSRHPDGMSTNSDLLEEETGDVLAAIDMLMARGLLRRDKVWTAKRSKLRKVPTYLHHAENVYAAHMALQHED